MPHDIKTMRDRLVAAVENLDETRLTRAQAEDLHRDVARLNHILRLWNEMHDVPVSDRNPPSFGTTYVATRADGRTPWRAFPPGTPVAEAESWLATAFELFERET